MKKFPVVLGGYEKIVHLFEIHSAPPPGIKNDHPLTKLFLNDNKITYLGSSVFDGLTYLSTLHLDNNVLGEIEENSFSSLKFLRGLFLGMNNLTSLSGCL